MKTAPIAARSDRTSHMAQFHADNETLTDRVCDFFSTGIASGDAVIMIATGEHRALVEACLRARGVDLAALRASGRYATLDASETLSQILVRDEPNALAFGEVVGGAISRLTPESGRVRAFGEMVSLLWADGRRDAAIRLEDLWNEWIGFHPLSLLCGYAFDGAIDATGFSAIAAAHSEVFPPARASRPPA